MDSRRANRMKPGNGLALRPPVTKSEPSLANGDGTWGVEAFDANGFGARADALFGDMPDGVVIQRDGRIVYGNPKMGEMLGLDAPASMIGMVALELYPEDSLPSVISRLQSAYFGKPSPVCEHRLVRADGKTMRCEVSHLLLSLAGEPMLIEIYRTRENEEENAVPKAWSRKDERQYEHVKKSERERGASEDRAEEIAARTVNKQRRKEGRTPNQTPQGTGNPNTPLDERTRDELYNLAKERNVKGRSGMSKKELVRALRDH